MSNILLVPKDCLDSKAKERLTKAGHIYIECDDPSKIIMLATVPLVPADDLLEMALDAIKRHSFDGPKVTFFNLFHEAVKKRNHPLLVTPQPTT